MFRRLLSALPRGATPGHRRVPVRRVSLAMLASTLMALWLVPTSAAEQAQDLPQAAAADQVLTWTAGDSMTEYNSAPAEATAGAATIVFENSLATGNTTGMTHTLTFDTSTPGYNHDVDLNIVASPYDANGGKQQAEVNLTPGKYRYFCAIPGHGTMVGEFVVTEGGGGEDTTAPQVSAQITGDQDADGNYIGSANVTVSATDADSGVASVEYEIDDTGFLPYTEPVTVDEPGDHAVQFRATDNAGNASETGSVPFSIVEPAPDDTTPPQVSAEVSGDQDAEGNYVGSATVTVTATDADSGVDTVEYQLDGGAYQAYTAPITVDTAGEHTVSFRATDNAGNVSAAGSVSFTVVEPAPDDTTPPQVSAEIAGDQDAEGNYVGSATVTVTATDADSGVDTVEYQLDGGAYQAYTAPVTVDTAGEHTLQYRATDNSGNTSEAGSVIFTITEPAPDDTTAPEVSGEVSGDQDAEGNYVGSATVTITASDADSGVDTVHFAVDGGSYSPYTEPIVVSEPGEHTVSFRATDNAGNTSEISSVSFAVVAEDPDDTTPPQLSGEVAGDQDAEGNYVGSATVTLSASDSGSGVFALRYSLDGGSFTPYSDPLVLTEPGEHTVLYRATDNAGNVSETGSLTFTVVASDSDACPGSDVRETVIIGNNDSTVANVDTGDGCTINDLIDENGEYANHGKFVKHVRQVTDALVADGIISEQEKGRIMNAAARSDVGK